MKKLLLLLSLVALAFSSHADTREVFNVYQKSKVIFTTEAALVDSVALEEDKTVVSLYRKDGTRLFSTSRANVDSMAYVQLPVADLLDLCFLDDGTAKDLSEANLPIETVTGQGFTTYYNDTYRRYVARFGNAWGSDASGFYRAVYRGNSSYIDALSDGHTMEVLVMGDYEGAIKNVEAKFFSSHQSGGTGFLVSNTSGSRKNELTFLPNVTTTGNSTWIWCNSGIVPKAKNYYHVVGVWNKSTQRAQIYVNGVLKKTVTAKGDLRLPTPESNHWFGIGADPSGTAGSQAWTGDVVMARIYDAPLMATDVRALWSEVEGLQANAITPMITDINYYSGQAYTAGSDVAVNGKGFLSGDQVLLVDVSTGNEYAPAVTLQGTAGIRLTLPDEFTTGTYRIYLQRDDTQQDLGLIEINIVETLPKGARVIAHRGAWKAIGTNPNSRAAVREACKQGYYGAEIDVWTTTDSVVVVNHDASWSGITLQNVTYDECKHLKLSNGEYIPLLTDMLDIIKNNGGDTKLIIELKSHNTAVKNMTLAELVVKAVKDAGVQDKVEYIAFSYDICKKLAKLDPQAHVALLTGGTAPAKLKQDGIMGLDYEQNYYLEHPEWIDQAHKLGMTVNVWTVNDEGAILKFNNMGVDYITTDIPVEAERIRHIYADQQGE